MAHEMKFGEATLAVIETREGRSRIELDGARRRVRAHNEASGWTEGDDADLGLLVRCLEDRYTKRTETPGKVVLEKGDFGLSGYDATTTVTITVDARGVVEVDMSHRVNDVNPHVGW